LKRLYRLYRLSVCLSVCPSVRPSVCPSLCPSGLSNSLFCHRVICEFGCYALACCCEPQVGFLCAVRLRTDCTVASLGRDPRGDGCFGGEWSTGLETRIRSWLECCRRVIAAMLMHTDSPPRPLGDTSLLAFPICLCRESATMRFGSRSVASCSLARWYLFLFCFCSFVHGVFFLPDSGTRSTCAFCFFCFFCFYCCFFHLCYCLTFYSKFYFRSCLFSPTPNFLNLLLPSSSFGF